MTSAIEAASGPAAPAIQALAMLEGLRELLAVAEQSLACGEPQALLDVTPGIALKTADLMTASLTLGRLPVSLEAQQRRGELLAELRRQCSYCLALLRRWRRSILLRRQLVELRDEPLPYTEVLEGRWY